MPNSSTNKRPDFSKMIKSPAGDAILKGLSGGSLGALLGYLASGKTGAISGGLGGAATGVGLSKPFKKETGSKELVGKLLRYGGGGLAGAGVLGAKDPVILGLAPLLSTGMGTALTSEGGIPGALDRAGILSRMGEPHPFLGAALGGGLVGAGFGGYGAYDALNKMRYGSNVDDIVNALRQQKLIETPAGARALKQALLTGKPSSGIGLKALSALVEEALPGMGTDKKLVGTLSDLLHKQGLSKTLKTPIKWRDLARKGFNAGRARAGRTLGSLGRNPKVLGGAALAAALAGAYAGL